jgi:hypothetical protein
MIWVAVSARTGAHEGLLFTINTIVMKRFKIGIAAIVAILAMSFTVASHQGAFKRIALNPSQVYVCRPGIDAFALFDCTNGIVIQQNQPCTIVQKQILPGHCVFNIVPAAGQRVCEGVNVFCCAQLNPPGSCPLCQGQPGQSVVRIWCYQ